MRKNPNRESKLRDARQAQRDLALPQVKKLVKSFGRTNVQWCLNQLADYERKTKELEIKKKEVAKLEKELK